MEILAPAGDYDRLKIAIQAGADAIYFAGQQFGARSFAGNFTDEELFEAIKHCHLMGKKAYITVNTLVKEKEWQAAKAFIDTLYRAQADAIIVQDFGVMSYIHKYYPGLHCHSSTQMTLYTKEGLAFAKSHGVSRVVVSRELDVDAIHSLCQDPAMEIEVFVHGALCYAVSGQCLMSSMIGGRSGNRGKCAQTCRKKYSVLFNDQPYGVEGYLLSMKDLNTLERLEALKAVGVSALKIEGRMRSAEYVATTVTAYRHALDQGLTTTDTLHFQDQLKRSFNREFTDGYVFKASGSQVVNPRFPSNQGIYVGLTKPNTNAFYLTIKLEETLLVGDKLKILDTDREYGIEVFHIYQGKEKRHSAYAGETIEIDFNNLIKKPCKVFKTFDFDLNLKMKALIDDDQWRVALDCHVIIQKDMLAQMVLTDDCGRRYTATSDERVSLAIKAPLSEEQVKQQILKVNDSVYKLNSIQIDLDEVCFMPVKALNALRRKAIEGMDHLRTMPLLSQTEDEEVLEIIQSGTNDKKGFDFIYYAHTEDQLLALNDSGIYTAFYYNVLTIDEAREKMDMILYPALQAYYNPKIWNSIRFKLKDEEIISVANAGQCEAFSDSLLTLDTPLNLTNIEAIRVFNENYNIQRAFLSVELSEFEQDDIIEHVSNAGIYFKGRPLVMSTGSCPAKIASGTESESCSHCSRGTYKLVDEKSAHYPFKCLYGTTHIYHHSIIQLDTLLHDFELKPFRSLKVELTTEDYEESIALLKTQLRLGYTGRLYREIE